MKAIASVRGDTETYFEFDGFITSSIEEVKHGAKMFLNDQETLVYINTKKGTSLCIPVAKLKFAFFKKEAVDKKKVA